MRHHFKKQLPLRSVELEITEALDAIYIQISCSNYDGLQHDMDFTMWLLPIVSRYDTDKRPNIITCPHSHSTYVVEGNAEDCIAYVIHGI
jgi:hypothetical protein